MRAAITLGALLGAVPASATEVICAEIGKAALTLRCLVPHARRGGK
jgi:hypothetical protein